MRPHHSTSHPCLSCAARHRAKQLIAEVLRRSAAPSIGRFLNSMEHPMSKKTRHADNSKRQQPVQQQRAQAATKQSLASKQSKAAEGNGSQRESSGTKDRKG